MYVCVCYELQNQTPKVNDKRNVWLLTCEHQKCPDVVLLHPTLMLMMQPANTHMEATLLLRLLNPADCLLSRLLMFSGEYGLLGRGGALSHLRCSRSAIVPEICRHKHELDRMIHDCSKGWLLRMHISMWQSESTLFWAVDRVESAVWLKHWCWVIDYAG